MLTLNPSKHTTPFPPSALEGMLNEPKLVYATDQQLELISLTPSEGGLVLLWGEHVPITASFSTRQLKLLYLDEAGQAVRGPFDLLNTESWRKPYDVVYDSSLDDVLISWLDIIPLMDPPGPSVQQLNVAHMSAQGECATSP